MLYVRSLMSLCHWQADNTELCTAQSFCLWLLHRLKKVKRTEWTCLTLWYPSQLLAICSDLEINCRRKVTWATSTVVEFQTFCNGFVANGGPIDSLEQDYPITTDLIYSRVGTWPTYHLWLLDMLACPPHSNGVCPYKTRECQLSSQS